MTAHDVVVRKATVDDGRQVADVMNAVIAEGELTLFDAPFSESQESTFIASLGSRSALHVAVVRDEIVGVQSIDLFANLSASTSHVAAMGTWLRPDARGRGIGRRLAAESFAFAQRHEYEKVVVQVLAGNERALRFYRGLGFVEIGVARRHVRLMGRLHDEVFLEKYLAAAPAAAPRRDAAT